MNKGIEVFIVEDESIVALELSGRLQELGYVIVGCDSYGEKAVVNIIKAKPDIVLMDINLAGELDGVMTVKLVNEELNVPIIYLTAYDDTETINKVKSSGFSVFLTKPFNIEELCANIDVCVDNHQKSQNKEAYSKVEIAKLLEEQKKLESTKEASDLYMQELTETNENLVNATWRERQQKEEYFKELQNQNKKISDSINYALRIQKAIIPDIKLIKSAFPNSFVMYKPKDVVSGDFPWMFKKGNHMYLAVVDCTGHGVPGAMMSFIGYFLLNEITNHKDGLEPSEILRRLNIGVVKTLRQNSASSENVRDGMDIALCRIDTQTNVLQYAGAHRPLYLLRNGEIVQHKGDRMSIGGGQYKTKTLRKSKKMVMNGNGVQIPENDKPKYLKRKTTFTNYNIDIRNDESIFIFSDGLPDQFGGPESMKYNPKRIRETILNNQGLSMDNLHNVFEEDYTEWSKGTSQTDDVLLIGIRF